MCKKMLCAIFVMTVSFAMAAADEYRAMITKIDGDNVTFQKYKKGEKGKKGEKDGDEVTLPMASDAKIVKGKFNKDDKKLEAGDAIEGGLKNAMFSKVSSDKGVNVRITTDADNKKITQIMTFQFGGFRKKKDASK